MLSLCLYLAAYLLVGNVLNIILLMTSYDAGVDYKDNAAPRVLASVGWPLVLVFGGAIGITKGVDWITLQTARWLNKKIAFIKLRYQLRKGNGFPRG